MVEVILGKEIVLKVDPENSDGKCVAGQRNSMGEDLRGKRGSPKHRANLKRLAFYLKSIGSP